MYEDFFQLGRRPFLSAPATEFYFASSTHEKAYSALSNCLERSLGPGLLIGAAGSGKTLLCMKLAEQMRRRCQVALLASGRLCTRRALLQAILFELGLPYQDKEEGELRLALIDHISRSGHPRGLLLIVDEAQTLPVRLLEEVRMISNLVRDGEPQVRTIVAGGPALEDRFSHPKLDSFNQRVAARCYLEPLDREETAAYVRHQLHIAGAAREIFTPEGLAAVYDATAGVPRLINQLCDHALLLASLGDKSTIDEAGVQESWADLQELPTPWAQQDRPEPTPAESRGIVEFGSLEDDGPPAAPVVEQPLAPSAEQSPEEKLPTAEGQQQGAIHRSNPAAESERQGASRRSDSHWAAEDERQGATHRSAATEPATGEPPHDLPEQLSDQAEEVEESIELPEEPLSAAQRQLEQIEEQVAAASTDDQAATVEQADACPPATSPSRPAPSPVKEDPVTTLTVHDPFGQEFAEEETVFDGLTAMLQALSQPLPLGPPQPAEEDEVSKNGPAAAEIQPAGDKASTAIDERQPVKIETLPAVDVTETVEAETSETEPAAMIPDVAPIRAEEETAATEESSEATISFEAAVKSGQAPAAARVAQAPHATEVHSPEGDDRDVIIIEDDEVEPKPAAPTGRVRRQSYDRLFANLRRG